MALNDRPDSWSLAPLLREDGLLDVLAGQAERKRASYTYRGRDVALDYILVTPALSRRLIPGSARVVDGPSVRAASDHRPVMVEFASGEPVR